MAQLEALLGVVSEGASATALITGEPGVGKSSIAAQLSRLAADREFLVLEGRAAEFEQDIPFGLLIDALDKHLRTLEPYDFARLGDEHVEELARVFPSLRTDDPDASKGDFADRVAFHRTVDELLSFLARSRPLLIVLDDAQWADPSSADLISHLMKRTPSTPLLLVITYRSNQVGDRLRATFGTETAHGRANLIEVPPLGPRDAAQIVELDPESDRFRHLYHQSGGNPFYLEQLARVAGQPEPVDETAEDGDVPAGVSAAVLREVDRLDDDARLVLNAASVVGGTFDPELIVAAADREPEGAMRVLDELVGLDLIRPADAPRTFRFRHPIVRRAVYEASGAAWRSEIHGRLAAALRERGASISELAHHVDRSARVGDCESIDLLAQAGQAVAARAPAAAAAWYAAALRLLPEGPEHDERRLELLAARAISLGLAGRLREGGDTLRSVLELLPPEMNELRVQAVLYAAVFQMLRSRHEEAAQMLHAALDQLDDHDSRAAMELKAELGGAALYASDPQATRKWALEALAMADGEPDDYLAAGVAALAAYGSVFAGEFEDTRALTERARATIDALPESEIALRVEGPLLLGGALLFLDDYRGAIRYIDRSNSVATSAGQAHHKMLGLAAKGWALTRMGRIEEARDCIDQAAEAASLAGNPAALVAAYAGRCMVEMADGTREAALEACDQAEAVIAADPGPYDDLLRQAMAFTLLEGGQARRAFDIVRRIGAKPYGTRIAPLECDRLLILTRAAIALGEVAEAEQAVIEAEQLAERSQNEAWKSAALQARCELRLAKGELEGARELALEAAERARTVDAVFAALAAQFLAARACVATDDKQGAIELLKATESELSSLGATRYRDQVAALLRELGTSASRPRPKRAENASLDVLSPREAQIAAMLPAGKSNREIADELVLSVRTVERHIAHILSKLNVSSRTAVAAIVERGRTGQAA